MKNILEIDSFLNEIGDRTAGSYKWRLILDEHDEVLYDFVTDGGNLYIVRFKKNPDFAYEWEWMFKVSAEGTEDFSYTYLTNSGEVYKVMTTNMEIVEDFIDNFLNRKLGKIIKFMGPEKEKNFSRSGESKRTRLYLAYFRKTFRKYNIEQDGNLILMTIPPKKRYRRK